MISAEEVLQKYRELEAANAQLLAEIRALKAEIEATREQVRQTDREEDACHR